MGVLYKQHGITIRVNGNEHPPIHAHVLHAGGKALVYLSGKTLNRGVPAAALKAAQAWIAEHAAKIKTEYAYEQFSVATKFPPLQGEGEERPRYHYLRMVQRHKTEWQRWN